MRLKLNKIYANNIGLFDETHYKIIFMNDDIAVGQSVWVKFDPKLEYGCRYMIFNNNKKSKCYGEKYYDGRLEYKLKKEIK